MTLIKLDKVKKYYGDRLILDIDNLEINEGDRIGIVGENGAGKTTLIKVILGNTEIDEGMYFLIATTPILVKQKNIMVIAPTEKLKVY